MILRERESRPIKIDSLRGQFTINGVDLLGQFYTRLYRRSFTHRSKLLIFAAFFVGKVVREDGVVDAVVHAVAGSYIGRRRDTMNMWATALSCLDTLDVARHRAVEHFSIIAFFDKIFRSIHFFRLLGMFGLSFFDRLMLSVCLSKAEKDAEYIDRWIRTIRRECNVVLTFCDAIGVENAVAQTANRYDIRTVTIQHGQYRRSGRKLGSPDDEAYKNFVSEFMLCWGRATIDELAETGIARERFFSSGRFMEKKPVENISADKSDCFGVVFSGENQSDKNYALLEFANLLARNLDMQYVVRLHPSNRASDYSKYVSGRCKCISSSLDEYSYYQSASFSVLMMTGLFLDFVLDRHPFVFYNDGTLPSVFSRSDLVVSSASDVNQKLSTLTPEKFMSLAQLYDDSHDQRIKVGGFFRRLCKV